MKCKQRHNNSKHALLGVFAFLNSFPLSILYFFTRTFILVEKVFECYYYGSISYLGCYTDTDFSLKVILFFLLPLEFNGITRPCTLHRYRNQVVTLSWRSLKLSCVYFTNNVSTQQLPGTSSNTSRWKINRYRDQISDKIKLNSFFESQINILYILSYKPVQSFVASIFSTKCLNGCKTFLNYN